jgi:GxxExxY protein
MDDGTCSAEIIGAAMRVHSTLGPGMLEGAYEACLAHELRARRLSVARQVPVSISYLDSRVEVGYRLDMLVDDSVVVEVKAVDQLLPIHEAQLITYLLFSGHRVGLLLNFNVVRMKDGIRRLLFG